MHTVYNLPDISMSYIGLSVKAELAFKYHTRSLDPRSVMRGELRPELGVDKDGDVGV